jgi:hypothetical protein
VEWARRGPINPKFQVARQKRRQKSGRRSKVKTNQKDESLKNAGHNFLFLFFITIKKFIGYNLFAIFFSFIGFYITQYKNIYIRVFDIAIVIISMNVVLFLIFIAPVIIKNRLYKVFLSEEFRMQLVDVESKK